MSDRKECSAQHHDQHVPSSQVLAEAGRRHSPGGAQEGQCHPAVLPTNAYKCTGTLGEGRATCRGGEGLNLEASVSLEEEEEILGPRMRRWCRKMQGCKLSNTGFSV